jgi:Branched-chain amino acid aminotransferase/4-amino-4-deoxychorismate lyase
MGDLQPYKNWCCVNGDFFDPDKPILKLQNRSFCYGDGLFETIHAYGTEPRHFTLHYKRLTKSMDLLGMIKPIYFEEEQLYELIVKLLNKMRIFSSARVRLSVFRKEGGYYTPETDNISFAIEATPLEVDKYQLNEKGLFIDLYTEYKKSINALANIKSANAIIYVLASRFKKNSNLGDCLLLNSNNNIIEATSSNIFLVKGKSLYTPSLEQGCVDGVMRKVIIDLAPSLGLEIKTNIAIDPTLLLHADEIFLTNAISGIRWVMGFNERRFFNNTAKKLTIALNATTFNS